MSSVQSSEEAGSSVQSSEDDRPTVGKEKSSVAMAMKVSTNQVMVEFRLSSHSFSPLPDAEGDHPTKEGLLVAWDNLSATYPHGNTHRKTLNTPSCLSGFSS